MDAKFRTMRSVCPVQAIFGADHRPETHCEQADFIRDRETRVAEFAKALRALASGADPATKHQPRLVLDSVDPPARRQHEWSNSNLRRTDQCISAGGSYAQCRYICDFSQPVFDGSVCGNGQSSDSEAEAVAQSMHLRGGTMPEGMSGLY